MEEDLDDVVPCSSLAVESILRVGTVTSFILVNFFIYEIKNSFKL
jgi:hypothetical protein